MSPVAGISLSQDVHRHHNFEVTLATDAFRQVNTDVVEKSKRFIGQELHLSFGSDLFRTTNPDHEFTGVVTEVAVNRFDNGDRSVTLRGHSPTIMLEGMPHCRSYTNKTIAEIVNATLENVPHSLKTLIDPTYKESIPLRSAVPRVELRLPAARGGYYGRLVLLRRHPAGVW